MEDSLIVIKNILIVMLNILAMIFVLVFIYGFTYQENYFEIKLNNNDLRCHYNEEYHNTSIINTELSGAVSNSNIQENIIAENNNYSLTVKEFEVFDKSKIRKENSYWHKDSSYNYQEVNDSIIKLKIETKDGILYDGDYKEDISEYITKKGRYYFHISVLSNRTPKYLAFVKTNISFNVIMGD